MAVPLSGQTSGYDRWLLPVAPSRVIGAFGSDWRTYAVVSNTGTNPVAIYGAVDVCNLPVCAPPPPLPGKASFLVTQTADCGGRGGFLYVEPGHRADITISLRSRDYSRALESWGTSIPVILTNELRAGVITITDVPVEQQFRATLRVLDVESATAGPVYVRVYGVRFPNRQQDAQPDSLVAEYTMFPVPPSVQSAPFCPGAAEIALPRSEYGQPYHALRLEITPDAVGAEYWAYVSVVDNVTQHLTILSPVHP